jgi:predicted metal-binding protein
MKAFHDAAAEKLFLMEEELEALLACFFSKLPETLKTKLLQRIPNVQKSFL